MVDLDPFDPPGHNAKTFGSGAQTMRPGHLGPVSCVLGGYHLPAHFLDSSILSSNHHLHHLQTTGGGDS